MMFSKRSSYGLFAIAILVMAAPSMAGSHLWIINEVFSNADGTIQFIEMKECCGADGETFLQNKWVDSDATTSQYIFSTNLVGPTGNKHLLLATAGFAALPGAPTPDHIISDNFVGMNGDTIRYWMYTGDAVMTIGESELPLDGTTSLNVGGTTGVNSPTNYAGQSGSVVAGIPLEAIPTVSEWGFVAMTLLMLTMGSILFMRRHQSLAR